MSAGENNPFARWSRRKLTARKAEALKEEKQAAECGDQDAERNDQQPVLSDAASEPEAAETSEPLPLIEDLTPESDLSVFFRKGVPATLRNTALRKMWSLDPLIRDYVGPAEYAWDFNKPGSMLGFGALEAGKSVADFLSKAASSWDTAAEPQTAPRRDAVTSADEDAAGTPQDTTASPDLPPEATMPGEPARLPEPPAGLSTSQAAEAATAATEPDAPAESPRKLPASRHGGALPR
jgi:hypothetical protein